MNPTDHFPPDYANARDRFRTAAETRGARLGAHIVPARGPAGEELAIDTAWIGPDHPARALVVSSGIHGAEGFAGSAVQHRLLREQLDGLALPADTGLLLVHAVNPYGFAHLRRVNESNVDLNRNFVAHPEGQEPNPHYDELYSAVNPERLDGDAEEEFRRAFASFVAKHGFPKLQEVVSRGQYVHPRGVQFGGQREEASNRALRSIAREETRGARRVAWLDIHTGLGPFGEVEMICEVPEESAWYRRGRAWYGDVARTTLSGESVSAALCGVVEHGLTESLPPDTQLTYFAAEFGTYDPVRVFRAMRADNWLHHHGDPDSEQGNAIRAEILEVFRPDDAGWQARILQTAGQLLEQTRTGLCAE